METVIGTREMFLKHRGDEGIILIVPKVTKYLLLAASIEYWNRSIQKLSQCFKISKSIVAGIINFNGAKLVQSGTGGIHMEIKSYMESIKPITLARSRIDQESMKAID